MPGLVGETVLSGELHVYAHFGPECQRIPKPEVDARTVGEIEHRVLSFGFDLRDLRHHPFLASDVRIVDDATGDQHHCRKARGALQHQCVAFQAPPVPALFHPALHLLPGPLHVAFGADHPAAFQFFGVEYLPDDAGFFLAFQLPETQFELFALVRGGFRYEKTSQQHTCLDE